MNHRHLMDGSVCSIGQVVSCLASLLDHRSLNLESNFHRSYSPLLSFQSLSTRVSHTRFFFGTEQDMVISFSLLLHLEPSVEVPCQHTELAYLTAKPPNQIFLSDSNQSATTQRHLDRTFRSHVSLVLVLSNRRLGCLCRL